MDEHEEVEEIVQKKYFKSSKYFCNWVSAWLFFGLIFILRFPGRVPVLILYIISGFVALISSAALVASISLFVTLGDDATQNDMAWAFLAFMNHLIPIYILYSLWTNRQFYFSYEYQVKGFSYLLLASFIAAVLVGGPYVYYEAKDMHTTYWFVDMNMMVYIISVAYIAGIVGSAWLDRLRVSEKEYLK